MVDQSSRAVLVPVLLPDRKGVLAPLSSACSVWLFGGRHLAAELQAELASFFSGNTIFTGNNEWYTAVIQIWAFDRQFLVNR